MGKPKAGEPEYRRGNKTQLRLSTVRRKRKRVFPKKKVDDTCEKTSGDNATAADNDSQLSHLSEEQQEVSIGNSNCETPKQHRPVLNDSDKHIDLADDPPFKISGQRIIDISWFLNELKCLSAHGQQFGCNFGNLEIVGELKHGLMSRLVFKCNMCNATFQVDTQPDQNVNKNAVVGMMNVGVGFSAMDQITAALDIPCMSSNTYSTIQNEVCNAWEQTALASMLEAGMEEKQLAIDAGDVNLDGVPYVTVICDGSWAKRSYRCNYNSLSGAAVIVGFRTKKVLYLGVRNKYCTMCNLNAKREKQESHKCYKNWSGSSTAMESDIIVEGFSKSLEMHGLIYNKMIADGDSSTFSKLLLRNPYTQPVKKIECRNHLLRNYLNKLRDICKDTKCGPIVLRRKLKESQLRLRSAVTKAVEYRRNQANPNSEKIALLKKDILNSHSHVFGEHKECLELNYFCQQCFTPNSVYSDIKLTDMFEKLYNAAYILAKHAESLLENVDSNAAEQLNSVIAKFTGGKRVNFTQRRSYQSRTSAAVLAYNTRRPIYTVKKYLSGKSPSKSSSRKELQRKNKKQMRSKAHRKLNFAGPDQDYGLCDLDSKPDMEEQVFKIKEQQYLANLTLSAIEIKILEEKTRQQADSDLWHSERRKRVTASKFGDICSLRETTSRARLIKAIVYPTQIFAKSLEYGKNNEKRALQELEAATGYRIKSCGLIVSNANPYLAASPDGIISNDIICEIKCPWSARDITPADAIIARKIPFFKINGEINKKHKWFYQIQGQLHITGANKCVFAVWTPKALKYVMIDRDDDFWQNFMAEKLKTFFFNHILPELVDSRLSRNLPLR